MFTFSYILSKVHTIWIFSLIFSIKCIIIGNDFQGWLADYQLLETEKLEMQTQFIQKLRQFCSSWFNALWPGQVLALLLIHEIKYGRPPGLYPSSSDSSAQVKAPSNPQCLLCGAFSHHH
jgi:hypothetical protein